MKYCSFSSDGEAKQVEIESCMTNRIEALFQLFKLGKKVWWVATCMDVDSYHTFPLQLISLA